MNRYEDDFADTLSAPAYGQQEPQRGWFGRNWFWFVPLLVFGPLFCCCGGGGILVWWAFDEMKDLQPYVDSVADAQQDPQVQQALGTPIEVNTVLGIPNGGEFNYGFDTNGETFDGEIPLAGSTASGTLRIEAKSLDGITWTYTVREVELPDGTVIDLIPAGSATPAKAPADDTAEDSGREIPDQQ